VRSLAWLGQTPEEGPAVTAAEPNQRAGDLNDFRSQQLPTARAELRLGGFEVFPLGHPCLAEANGERGLHFDGEHATTRRRLGGLDDDHRSGRLDRGGQGGRELMPRDRDDAFLRTGTEDASEEMCEKGHEFHSLIPFLSPKNGDFVDVFGPKMGTDCLPSILA